MIRSWWKLSVMKAPTSRSSQPGSKLVPRLLVTASSHQATLRTSLKERVRRPLIELSISSVCALTIFSSILRAE